MKIITLYVFFASIVSQLLAFVREVMMAANFGASKITDAYVISMLAPTIIIGFIASGISAVYSPSYARIAAQFNKVTANLYTKSFCFLLFFVGVGLSFLSLVLYKLLGSDLFYGFNSSPIYFQFFAITVFSMPFLLASNILASYLNIRGHYVLSAFSVLPINVISITFILLSVVYEDVALIAYGYLFGVICTFLIQFFSVKTDVFNSYKLGTAKEIRKSVALACPVIFGVVFNQLNFVIDRGMAISIAEGALSTLNYAVRIGSITEFVIVATLLSLFFPIMNQKYSVRDFNKLSSLVNELVILLIFLTVPISGVLYFYSLDIIKFIFERGQFNGSLSLDVSRILSVYSIAIPFIALKLASLKVFYCRGETFLPMIVSIIFVIINVVGNVVLIEFYALLGLAYSTVICAILSSISLFYLSVRNTEISIDFRFVLFFILFAFSAFFISYSFVEGLFEANLFIEVVCLFLLYLSTLALVVFKSKFLKGLVVNFYIFKGV
ncbi:lipid II flippase MurJ [Pseudoalteromonas sp. OANN1]|uniref:murein biosynthesis integral membrane protein MurJ n=1 Tax=Pseudoalteromonas sp. OANN1 TaxID=2954497 RepID=UPI002096C8F8|nr:lipid II flippase MurJ [Pseudoalteromonas sp. OANN1]MCO7198253.1 polysaccharide biosynthesis C-terminal domain-containing protein [Pseudoalteromonas sp. OANN1]